VIARIGICNQSGNLDAARGFIAARTDIMSLSRYVSNAGLLGRVFARKPKFLARTAAGFARAALLGQHRMRFMDIAVDYNCNLSCSHCSALPMSRADEKPLSVEQYKVIAQDLLREGVVLFHFTGGEPLLRKDLEEIIAAFDPSRSCISIQSNGFPATPKRLKSLRGAGVDIFCVSLDSGIEAEHDQFRNREGSYRKVMDVLALARDTGFITTVSTCVSHDNIRSEGLRRVIEMTAQMGISCQFNLAVPTGHWQENAAIVLTEQDRAEVRCLLDENPHCRLDLNHNWNKVGCGTIKEKLYLTPYGDVLPCPFIHISFGNLKTDRLSAVRERAFQIPEFQSYWPSCLAAEDHDFMERIARFSEGHGALVPFEPQRWSGLDGQREAAT
jgi:MoaA/NifB/PqqE/SkfB family radical SAM enzyme